MPKYFCICGRSTEYQFEKPEKCAHCQKSFTAPQVRKVKPIKYHEEVEDDIDTTVDEPDVPHLDKMELSFEKENEDLGEMTIGDVLSAKYDPEDLGGRVERVKPPKMSRKKFLKQLQEQAGSLRSDDKPKRNRR